MTARHHFDRLAQPRQGEPLVLSPAAPWFPASPDPLAPIGLEHEAPQPVGQSPLANSAPVAQAPPVAPVLSPAPQRLARKLATATPPAVAAPTLLPPLQAIGPTPPTADSLPPPGAEPPTIGQPAPSAPTPSTTRFTAPGPAPAAASPAPSTTAATPSIATSNPPKINASTLDLPEVPPAPRATGTPAPAEPPASGPPAASDPAPSDPAPLRPMAAPSLDLTPPRRRNAVLTPASAPRQPTPDLGVSGLGAWLDGTEARPPAPAIVAPATGGIHIGVVEVRVAPPPPAPQVQHRAPVAAEPSLARGYGWRFGLGQS